MDEIKQFLVLLFYFESTHTKYILLPLLLLLLLLHLSFCIHRQKYKAGELKQRHRNRGTDTALVIVAVTLTVIETDLYVVMDEMKMQRAKEALDLAYMMSNLLNTGLDRSTLAIIIALCEHGINPEALAAVVKELRRESSALRSPRFSPDLK